MIVLELISSGKPTKEILQIWYSSCISKEASVTLRDCCRKLEQREKDSKVKKLFQHWNNARIGVKEAKAICRQYSEKGTRDIDKFKKESDRVYYARYILTGEIFVQLNEAKEGNVT